MRVVWFVFLSWSSIGSVWCQSYTYVSPSIVHLQGARFSWKLFNGWRLITPAEGAVYKGSTMLITLQKADMRSHRVQQVSGSFVFDTSKGLRDKKVVDSSGEKALAMGQVWFPTPHSSAGTMEALYRVPKTDRNLWVKLTSIPKPMVDFWRVELGKLQIKAAR